MPDKNKPNYCKHQVDCSHRDRETNKCDLEGDCEFKTSKKPNKGNKK